MSSGFVTIGILQGHETVTLPISTDNGEHISMLEKAAYSLFLATDLLYMLYDTVKAIHERI